MSAGGRPDQTASWAPVPKGSDFPSANLPYGVFRRPGSGPAVGVRVGDNVVDLGVLHDAGLLPGTPREALRGSSLNPLLALGPAVWRPLRARLRELLADRNHEVRSAGVATEALVALSDVELVAPIEPGDYVDFYSSLEHATNMGRMLRGGAEPLPPNWRHLPIGYHGKAGSVVVSGTPVVRPRGQVLAGEDRAPAVELRPTRMLDFELEVGFVTGPGNASGEPIPVARAAEHIFGVVLVNDWSARDIQRWEYVPLGPFLSKSFATSISAWVVTLDALEPHRVAGPEQHPPPLDYLRSREPWALDLDLEVELSSSAMAEEGVTPAVVASTNFRHMYWNMAQQLAHVTSNGARVRPGDLYASGTVSGPGPRASGSLMELTSAGARPLTLPDGTERSFLEDGDTVTMRGRCRGPGGPRVGLGTVTGTVTPA